MLKSSSICVPISGRTERDCHGLGKGEEDARDDAENALEDAGE
jgi:predicted RNase H-like HicB family nuclease